MGLIRPKATVIRFPVADQPRHNASSIDFAGLTRDQAKRLIYEHQGLTAASRQFLAWAADKSATYTFTVTTARAELNWGKVRWRSCRQSLERLGVLCQQKALLPDASSHWTLAIDFAPLKHPRARDGSVSTPYPTKSTPRRRPPGRQAGTCCLTSQGSCQLPAIPAPPARPGWAGGVLDPQKEKSMQDDFLSAREFFDFLARNGVDRVRLAAQMRRKADGQRGAPLGFGSAASRIGEGAPVPAAQAADLAQSLLARLTKMGKHDLELVTAAAEDPKNRTKSILVDDLNAEGVEAVQRIWNGLGAILETSPGNYQAILILPELLARAERKSITDQMVAMAGGDVGAKGAQQLHRFPGSVNYKRALAEPFICRLVKFFKAAGPGIKAETPAPTQLRPAVSPTFGALRRVRALRPLNWKEPPRTTSEAAFRLAADMLRSGTSETYILAALSAPDVLRHHHPKDWPERTLARAKAFLAGDLYPR